MAREVVPMDVRLRIAVVSKDVNVSAFCRQYGLSRETFYVWRRRFEAEGLDGLEPRSRAPRTSPQRISDALIEAIIDKRKELDELGVDAGAGTIQWHLGRDPRWKRAVASQATI